MERKTNRDIYFLEWDDNNEQHFAEHGVRPEEVRQMLANRHLTIANRRAPGRVTLLGETNGGRLLAVALDPTDDAGTWRPVTGLPASAEDRGIFNRYCR